MALETKSFNMTYGGYLAYVHHYRFVKTWAYRAVLYGTFVVMFIILALLIYQKKDMDTAIGLLVPMAILLVWHALMNLAFPVWGLWSAKRRGVHKHDCKVYIDESHIWTIDAENEIRKPWQSIESVFATRKYIFIYFNKCNAFIIPKSAFNSAIDADSFFQKSQSFLAASKKSA